MDNSSTLPGYNVFVCIKESHGGVILSCIMMLSCFFLGTPVNFWFLWFSLRTGLKIKPTWVFFINHTVLDLIYCIQCGLNLLNMMIFNNDQLWKETFIILGLSSVGRPLMQICVCVEQYLAVLHPVIFLKYNGIQYRVALALLVWLILAVYVVYEAFVDIFPDPFFCFIFLAAVAVISFCCASVLRVLKHPGPGDTQTTVGRGRDMGNQQKRNAFVTIFIGWLLILFSYLPQVLLALFIVIKIDDEVFYCDIVPVIHAMNMFGVMITPLLKMCREGHLKCFDHLRTRIVNRRVGSPVLKNFTQPPS